MKENLYQVLIKKNPSRIRFWDQKKNKIKINQAIGTLRKKYYWKCENCLNVSFICSNGDIWRKDIRQRKYCITCSNKFKGKKYIKLMIFKNGSAVDKFPEIINEWDYDKNLKSPEEYSAFSHSMVYFKCLFGHNSYLSSITNKTFHKSKCPKCRIRSSSHEIRIYTEMKHYFKNVIWQKKIDKFEIDIFLEDKNIGIELDGGYFHTNRSQFDKKKSKFLKKKKIRLLRVRDFRLPKINGNVLKIDTTKELQVSDFKLICKNLEIKYKLKELSKARSQKKFYNELAYKKILKDLPRPPLEKSLLIKKPKIAEEFDLDKNFPFRPEYFWPGSKKSVHWLCKKNNHSWKTSINNRTRQVTFDKKRNCYRRPSNCPVC